MKIQNHLDEQSEGVIWDVIPARMGDANMIESLEWQVKLFKSH